MHEDSDGGFANPANLVRLGCALMASGRGGQAVALVKSVLAANPGDRLLREAAGIVLTHQVADFHGNMLADTIRNDAYEAAIVRAAPGRTVLDIGAGSGLLAMMAARAGARHVFACEANEALAATARDIVAANGFSDVVTVLAKNSAALDPVTDLGGGVDLVVSEIFSHDLIGEGALPSLRDAAARLVAPGAATIPARASVRVALAAYRTPRSASSAPVSGFDLSLFDRHMSDTVKVRVDEPRLEMRSDPADLFTFDLGSAAPQSATSGEVSAVSTGGTVDGVVQWLHLRLDAETVYENRPGRGRGSHWPALFHPLPRSVAAEAGEAIRVEAWHDDQHLRIWATTEARQD